MPKESRYAALLMRDGGARPRANETCNTCVASQPFTFAVIRAYDETGNVSATHEHEGDFSEAS